METSVGAGGAEEPWLITVLSTGVLWHFVPGGDTAGKARVAGGGRCHRAAPAGLQCMSAGLRISSSEGCF